MSFGKSKARMLSEDQVKTTFADVAGCDEAPLDFAAFVAMREEQRLEIENAAVCIAPLTLGFARLARERGVHIRADVLFCLPRPSALLTD